MEDNCFVYFVRNPRTKKIKIGKSVHPKQRIKEIENKEKTKLDVLLVIGYNDLELHMHDVFAHLRQEGEWFTPGEDLIEFLLTTKAHTYEEKPEQRNTFSFLFRIVQFVGTFVIFLCFNLMSFLIISSMRFESVDMLTSLFTLWLMNALFSPAIGTAFAFLAVNNNERGYNDN